MITHFKGFVYGVDASAMFAQAMSLLQKGLIAVGAFLVVVGIVNLATNIKDVFGMPFLKLSVVLWSGLLEPL
ncbi:Uncharacterised protein [Streptococcus pneumoniae]|nr:Uncharacterised protein [Streptococcus pneumoniae]VTE77004.1 Uncharacterised protein [Streptococcus pneumoniae]